MKYISIFFSLHKLQLSKMSDTDFQSEYDRLWGISVDERMCTDDFNLYENFETDDNSSDFEINSPISRLFESLVKENFMTFLVKLPGGEIYRGYVADTENNMKYPFTMVTLPSMNGDYLGFYGFYEPASLVNHFLLIHNYNTVNSDIDALNYIWTIPPSFADTFTPSHPWIHFLPSV